MELPGTRREEYTGPSRQSIGTVDSRAVPEGSRLDYAAFLTGDEML